MSRKAKSSDPERTGGSGAPDAARYVLRLYITSSTPQSARAIANVRRLCEEYLEDRYDLEVMNLAERPSLAAYEQIIAAPTLIKMLPLPLRRFIGDMSRTDRILVGLNLHPAASEP